MEENKKETTYTVVNYSDPKKEKRETSFGKSVLLPFISGVLGATLVVGTCFSVPSIKNTLLNQITQSVSTPTSSNGSSNNVTYVSLSDYSDTAIAVADKVRPSIVGIKVEYSVNSMLILGSSSTSKAEGSGIIISEDGYILTNNHIVNSSSSNSYYELSKATKVTVTLLDDETEYEAKIIGTDEQTDLAVIKIDKTGLTPAELGDSDSVRVGEFSMAIGNPLGLQSSVTGGLISALNREVTDSDGKTFILIQTDAAINSGNSGGALVNAKGQVIGVNTLKLQGTGVEGMGFAIPINSTREIYQQLIENGKVKRPFIGITGKDLSEELARKNNLVVGIYISAIEDFSAAQKAGLKIGDVIIEADGKSVSTMDELTEIKNTHQIGDTMQLKVNRNGTELDITLTLGEQP